MDAQTGELGDPVNKPEATKPRRGARKLPTKEAKVVPISRGRRKKLEQQDTELAAQLDKEQDGRNMHGIEGRENVHLAFLRDMQAHKTAMGKLRMKWAARCQKAQKDGVNTKAVTDLLKELGEDPKALELNHNIMNQLRSEVGLPAFAIIDVLRPGRTETERLRDAYKAGEAHCWRLGREEDNRYADDQMLGQEWIKGFRDAEEKARVAASVR